jgi:DNA-binding response OmpR family regulator
MKKILIVEDEVNLTNTLKMRFEASGFEVDVAYDGQEALQKVRDNRPDLILLDLMLPKVDGYKVCRMLKYDEKYKSIPIIILTARAQEKDRDLAVSMGADAYIVKPFESKDLIQKANELMGGADPQ